MALQDRLGVRLLNRLGDGLQRMGLKIADFEPDRLEAAARRKTRLDDFGPARYRAPFERLCESYLHDCDLTFLGRVFCHGTLLHALTNRLLIQQALRNDPGICQEEVRRPLFVLGLPRTGTTFLFNLLAQDPACRPLMFWESMSPAPPPRPETYATDSRIAEGRRKVRFLNRALPELSGIHEFTPDGPEECLGLLMNVFLTPFVRGRVPLYREWLDQVSDAEIDAAYAEYRTQLQLLQRHAKGEHWILKCPSHAFGLGGLLANFPDAAIVQTHRDLSRSVPSLCSLSFAFEQLCYQTPDRQRVGRGMLKVVEQLITRGIQGRERGDPDGERVLDVAYADVTRAPIATVERIYGHFGYDLSSEFRTRLNEYLARDKHGSAPKHTYSLAEFGITPEELRNRFGGYASRFQVPSDV
jgi:hypothetical protein